MIMIHTSGWLKLDRAPSVERATEACYGELWEQCDVNQLFPSRVCQVCSGRKILEGKEDQVLFVFPLFFYW